MSIEAGSLAGTIKVTNQRNFSRANFHLPSAQE
jgi:hypothetical protein